MTAEPININTVAINAYSDNYPFLVLYNVFRKRGDFDSRQDSGFVYRNIEKLKNFRSPNFSRSTKLWGPIFEFFENYKMASK